MDTLSAQVREWSVLQTQSDDYEKHTLYIKLLSVGITAAALLMNNAGIGIALLIAILWLQDAIWKTFQSRISDHLLKVEQALQDHSEQASYHYSPCQLNTHWMKQRSGFSGLIKEYLSNALRPTIAFPYILLITLILLF